MQHVVRAGLCALVAACALAFAAPAGAAPPQLPTQGVYEWCNPATSADGCVHRLQLISQAGFRVVANDLVFQDLTEERIRAYAQAAAAAGVRVIWPLHTLPFRDADPHANNLLATYPDLAARCGCSDNQGLFAYLIGVLRGLPNTWGYYLVDEPAPSTHSALIDWVARIKALDPDHPRIIMGCGICEGGPDKNVAWFADLDVTLGTDAYPVFGGAPDPSHSYTSVAQNVSALDRIARGAGRPQVIALQSWSWGDSEFDSQAAGVDPASMRYPTREEIEAQRNAAIQNAHPDLILWFTLTQVIGWEPGQRPWYWAEPSDPAHRWSNLIDGAFAPPPSQTASVATASAASPALLSNRAPRARFTLRRGSRSRPGNRYVADGGTSRDSDGRIVRFAWRLNGKRLAGCRTRRCVFRVRHRRAQRLTLTVTDNRGARAAAQRRFLVPAVHKGRRAKRPS
jgi:hypothetical protein